LTPVSLEALLELYEHMKKRVKYVYGAKASSLSMDSHDITGIDCSGWTRYALAKATGGQLVLPDGSQVQLAWAENSLHKLDKYSDVLYAKDDPNRLFIAFLRVTPNRKIGHVWLVHQGMTLESHGGVGVDSRPWDSLALKSCTDCFEVPATA